MNWMNIHYIYDDVQVGCPTKKIFLIYCTFHLINHFFFFFFSKLLLVFKYTESNFQWIQYIYVRVWWFVLYKSIVFKPIFLYFYSKIRFKLIKNGDTRLEKFKKKRKNRKIRYDYTTGAWEPLSIHLIYICFISTEIRKKNKSRSKSRCHQDLLQQQQQQQTLILTMCTHTNNYTIEIRKQNKTKKKEQKIQIK